MSTILIHPNTALLRELLAETGAQIQVAGEFSDSPAGLAAVGRLRPDVVFVSMDIADWPSSELLGKLVEQGVEVVAMSQWGTFAYEAMRFGAIGFLVEPIQLEDLQEIIPRLEKRLHEKRILRAAQAFSEEICPPNN